MQILFYCVVKCWNEQEGCDGTTVDFPVTTSNI